VVVREDIGESIGHRSAKTGKEYLKSLSEEGTEREEGTMCCMLVGMRVYLFKEPGGLFSSFLWRWRFSW
jgi:hypothetical protein